jgi:hypothetical protein
MQSSQRSGYGAKLYRPSHAGKVKVTAEINTCAVLKPANCKVKEPILVPSMEFETFHNGGGETERGVETSGVPPITSITLENKAPGVCALAGTFAVEGRVRGALKGATVYYEAGGDSLTFGKEAADLEGAVTASGRLNSSQVFTPLAVTTTAS